DSSRRSVRAVWFGAAVRLVSIVRPRGQRHNQKTIKCSGIVSTCFKSAGKSSSLLRGETRAGSTTRLRAYMDPMTCNEPLGGMGRLLSRSQRFTQLGFVLAAQIRLDERAAKFLKLFHDSVTGHLPDQHAQRGGAGLEGLAQLLHEVVIDANVSLSPRALSYGGPAC